MKQAQSQQRSLLISPQVSTATVSAAFDTLGADYATIQVAVGTRAAATQSSSVTIAITEAAVPSTPTPTPIRRLASPIAVWTGTPRSGGCQYGACASHAVVCTGLESNIGTIGRPCVRFLILTRKRGGRKRWREIGRLGQLEGVSLKRMLVVCGPWERIRVHMFCSCRQSKSFRQSKSCCKSAAAFPNFHLQLGVL
jgi:hypothetical protein